MDKYFYTSDEMEKEFRNTGWKYLKGTTLLPEVLEYSMNQLVTKMRELNHLDIEINKEKSIAVVGNSGKLLTQEQGEFIDSHDIVFRCNLAITDKYENNVGSKTDFRFIAGKSFWRNLTEQFSSYKDDFLTNLKDQHFIIRANPVNASIQGIMKHYNTKSNISYLRLNVINNMQKQIGINDISLGMAAIEIARKWSDNVSLFGFTFFQEGWNEQHYFENITPYSRGHHPLKEKEYVDYLVEQKMVKIY